jgi:hypothetical protein
MKTFFKEYIQEKYQKLKISLEGEKEPNQHWNFAVGDTIRMGRFKNQKTIIKKIDINDKGDLTINNKPILKFRSFIEINDSK